MVLHVFFFDDISVNRYFTDTRKLNFELVARTRP